MFKKVLVGVDGSEPSVKAIQAARELLGKGACEEVTAVFALTHLGDMAVKDFLVEKTQASPEQLAEANGILEGAIKQAGGNEKIKTRIETGLPSEVILNLAKKEGYDLIVVGHRGFGHLKKLLLGSVGAQIVQSAHCTVMVVR